MALISHQTRSLIGTASRRTRDLVVLAEDRTYDDGVNLDWTGTADWLGDLSVPPSTVISMDVSSGLISLRLAMSLDGYIADADGGYDWIVPVPSPTLDTDHQLPFDAFLDGVDVVVMGRRCYDQGQHRDYVTLGKRVIVATSRTPVPEATERGVDFVADSVVEVVKSARDSGQHCFLFGGGVLVESFLQADAVDALTVGIVPILLGSGRRLFPNEHPTLELRLTDYTVESGKVRLVYKRR